MSTTNNNAPFANGQKIVRTGKTLKGIVTKGETYTAGDCYQCPCCGLWIVDVKETVAPPNGQLDHCDIILNKHPVHLSGHANLFAPINPSYSDATQSILEQFRKDEAVKDRADSPVKEIINQ